MRRRGSSRTNTAVWPFLMLAYSAQFSEIVTMWFRKNRVLIARNAKSVRVDDPLSSFKRQSQREMGKYQVRGEVWKSVKKLLAVAAFLAIFYFIRECWLAWDIFQ